MSLKREIHLVMIAIAGIVVLIGCYIFPAPEQKQPPVHKTQEEHRIEYNRDGAKELSRELVFFKHRSGLCFAYAWHGSSAGGPALAQVPCAEVENDPAFVKDIK
jgi:hypothetical protein